MATSASYLEVPKHSLRVYCIIFCFTASIVFLSCSTSRTGTEAGNSAQDARRIELAAERNPDNIDLQRQAGVLYVKSRQYERGAEKLRQVLKAKPDDPEALFYLGMAYEGEGKDSLALNTYRQYSEIPATSSFRGPTEGRYLWLGRKLHQSSRAVAGEVVDSLGEPPLSPTTVAVFPFVYAGDKPEYEQFGRGFSEILASDLSYVKSIWVIDPTRVRAVLRDEQFEHLQTIDPPAARDIGRKLGAGRIVGGMYTVLDGGILQIDFISWDLVNKKFPDPTTKMGNVKTFHMMEKEVLTGILNSMKINTSVAEGKQLKTHATQNLAAFLAYSNALADDDEERYDLAAQGYLEAIKLDPSFADAVDKEYSARLLRTYGIPDEQMLRILSEGKTPSFRLNLISNRLHNLQLNAGANFAIGQDLRKGAVEALGGVLPAPPPPPAH